MNRSPLRKVGTGVGIGLVAIIAICIGNLAELIDIASNLVTIWDFLEQRGLISPGRASSPSSQENSGIPPERLRNDLPEYLMFSSLRVYYDFKQEFAGIDLSVSEEMRRYIAQADLISVEIGFEEDQEAIKLFLRSDDTTSNSGVTIGRQESYQEIDLSQFDNVDLSKINTLIFESREGEGEQKLGFTIKSLNLLIEGESVPLLLSSSYNSLPFDDFKLYYRPNGTVGIDVFITPEIRSLIFKAQLITVNSSFFDSSVNSIKRLCLHRNEVPNTCVDLLGSHVEALPLTSFSDEPDERFRYFSVDIQNARGSNGNFTISP